MAMFTALWELSAVLSGPGFGKYADIFGDQAMFALASLVALVGLVSWAVFEHAHVSSEFVPAGVTKVERAYDQGK